MTRWRIFDQNDRQVASLKDPAAVLGLLPAGGRIRYGRRLVWRDDYVSTITLEALLHKALSIRRDSERQALSPVRLYAGQVPVRLKARALGVSARTLHRRLAKA